MACTLLAAASVPAFALGESPAAPASIVAHDDFFQDGSSADTSDHVVQIVAGETVDFSNPGAGSHNVKFATAPTSCTQTSGTVIPGFPVPPLPAFPVAGPWTGHCTFSTPGTYTFVCDAHPVMVGTVEVIAAPTPTATATQTATATATASPAPAATIAATPPPAPPTPVVLSDPLPKLGSAVFKRSKKTLTFAGTIAPAATGKVKVELSYKVGKAIKKKSASPAIAAGKYKGTIKLSAGDAKKATKLKLTVTYAGNSAFKAATKTGSVKVSR